MQHENVNCCPLVVQLCKRFICFIFKAILTKLSKGYEIFSQIKNLAIIFLLQK